MNSLSTAKYAVYMVFPKGENGKCWLSNFFHNRKCMEIWL